MQPCCCITILLFHIRPRPTPRPYHLRPVTGIASEEAGSIRAIGGEVLHVDLRLLLQRLHLALEPRERTRKVQRRLPSPVLHAPERSSCPLGDDRGPGEPLQGRRVQLQYNIRHFRGLQDLLQHEGGREDRDTNPLRRPSFTTWMSGKINGILAVKDLFPCGDRNESGFSPDFQVPLSILVQVLNERKQRFEGLRRLSHRAIGVHQGPRVRLYLISLCKQIT